MCEKESANNQELFPSSSGKKVIEITIRIEKWRIDLGSRIFSQLENQRYDRVMKDKAYCTEGISERENRRVKPSKFIPQE